MLTRGIATLAVSLVLATLSIVAAQVAPPPAGGAAAKIEDSRKEVSALVDQLREVVKQIKKENERYNDVEPLMKLVEQLGAEAERSGPKDRSAIARVLGDLTLAFAPTTKPGTLGSALAATFPAKIGACGAEGLDVLIKLHKDKKLAKLEAYGGVYAGLGRTGTREAFDILLRAAQERDPRSIHLAANGFEASRGFDGASRKSAFQALIAAGKHLRDTTPKSDRPVAQAHENALFAVGKALAVLARDKERELDAWEKWAADHADAWKDEAPAPAGGAGK